MIRLLLVLLLAALATHLAATNLALSGVHLDSATRAELAQTNTITTMLIAADVLVLLVISIRQKRKTSQITTDNWPNCPP